MPKTTPIDKIAAARPRQWYDHRTWRNGRRRFSNAVMRQAWARCCEKDGRHHCESCGAPVTGAGDIVFDHVVAWELTRDSSLANCQVLCRACDRAKTPRDISAIAKADRVADKHVGITGIGRGRHPMPAGRASRVSKTMRHGLVRRLSQAEKHRAFIAARFGGGDGS